jgi:predicted nuclease of predicted toxin-antitoxin system
VRIVLYLDEDTMSADLVKALRSQGLEVVTAQDAGMTGKSDEEHLRYAASRGLVLYSFNIADHAALHSVFLQQGASHAGLILAEQQRRYSVGEQMRRLLKLIGANRRRRW